MSSRLTGNNIKELFDFPQNPLVSQSAPHSVFSCRRLRKLANILIYWRLELFYLLLVLQQWRAGMRCFSGSLHFLTRPFSPLSCCFFFIRTSEFIQSRCRGVCREAALNLRTYVCCSVRCYPVALTFPLKMCKFYRWTFRRVGGKLGNWSAVARCRSAVHCHSKTIWQPESRQAASAYKLGTCLVALLACPASFWRLFQKWIFHIHKSRPKLIQLHIHVPCR